MFHMVLSTLLKDLVPAGIYLLKVYNGNTRTMCEVTILTIKAPERLYFGMAMRKIKKRTDSRTKLKSIQYIILDSFKDGVVLLCYSIFKAKKYQIDIASLPLNT